MIYIAIVVIALMLYFGYECFQLKKSVFDLNERVIHMSLQVSQNTAAAAVAKARAEKNAECFELLSKKYDQLNSRVDELEEKTDVDKTLEKALEKKWEDAIQIISNYDPFGEEEK